MKPDKKYMSQINIDDNNINFIPPSFDRSLVKDSSKNDDNFLDLYPSETSKSELYCYYNSLGDCNNQSDTVNTNMRIPTPSEILRNFDLDLDESIDLERNCCNTNIDKIYLDIEKKHPGIFATFSSYGIPFPITKVIIKRLIKLSLFYCDKK